jgi:O-Antigen ligase
LNFNRLWSFAIGGFLFGMVFLSAFSRSVIPAILFVQVVSLLLLVLGVFRLSGGLPTKLSGYGILILLIGVAAIAIQLVPLPPEIWSNLPGRQFIVETNAVVGVPLGWMPLSLSSLQTARTLTAILPAAAIFIATLSINRSDLKYIMLILLGVGLANSVLGLAQKMYNSNDALLWSPNAVVGTASGVLANRNHYAALIYIMLPILVAVALGFWRTRRLNGAIIGFFVITLAAALIVALGAAGSRAGIALAMAAIVLSSFLAMSSDGANKNAGHSKWIAAFVTLAFLVIAQFGLVAILRLAATDPVSDLRNVISNVSWQAMREMLPLGSGFGSFVEIYQLFEQPTDMIAVIINEAHNDWLQIAIEGGFPAILGMALFVLWFSVGNFKLWRQVNPTATDLMARAAGIAALLLLAHSLVDYPLRAQLLMTLFGFFCGLIAIGPSTPLARKRQFRLENSQEISRRPMLAQVTAVIEPRKGPYFVKKDPPISETQQ